MRAAIFALMTTLWCSASPVWARNGETGILIVPETFEFVEDSQHHTSLVLCNEDLERIQKALHEGYTTSIYLPGYGIYEVEETESGAFKIDLDNIDIQSRECHRLLSSGQRCG